MASLRALERRQAARLLEPGPVTLVTTLFRSQHNVMAAAWVTPMGNDPALIAIAIQPDRLTHEFITRGEFFGVSIPTIDLLNAVHRCGVESGRDRDKFLTAGLTPMDAAEIEAPLVEECVAHIECGVIERISLTNHDLFIGEVLAASVVDELFSDRWVIQEGSELLHHIAGDQYAALGRVYRARLEDEET